MKRELVLITGASSGIGLEMARDLAKRGFDLILVARNENRLQELARELHVFGVTCHVLAADLSTLSGAQEMVAQVQAQKWDVEILINNAGFGLLGSFVETDTKIEQEMIQLNISSLTYLSKIFLAPMLERGHGRIVNVASTAAFLPGPLMSVYYATKAYVLSFTEALAEEVRGTGVKVTAICPGATASGFQDAAHLQNVRLLKMTRIPTSAEVAKGAVRALLRGDRVWIHGIFNKVMVCSLRLMPRWMIPPVVKAVHQ